MTKSNNNSTEMNIWEKNLRKARAKEEEEKKRIKMMLETGELYNNMVDEAVELITTKIAQDAAGGYGLEDEKDGVVTITVYKAFTISAELHLYSECYSIPTNPKTGKQYFYNLYVFKDEDEVKKYLDDVKAKLPKEVHLIERLCGENDVACPGDRLYSAKVRIKLND